MNLFLDKFQHTMDWAMDLKYLIVSGDDLGELWNAAQAYMHLFAIDTESTEQPHGILSPWTRKLNDTICI